MLCMRFQVRVPSYVLDSACRFTPFGSSEGFIHLYPLWSENLLNTDNSQHIKYHIKSHRPVKNGHLLGSPWLPTHSLYPATLATPAYSNCDLWMLWTVKVKHPAMDNTNCGNGGKCEITKMMMGQHVDISSIHAYTTPAVICLCELIAFTINVQLTKHCG